MSGGTQAETTLSMLRQYGKPIKIKSIPGDRVYDTVCVWSPVVTAEAFHITVGQP